MGALVGGGEGCCTVDAGVAEGRRRVGRFQGGATAWRLDPMFSVGEDGMGLRVAPATGGPGVWQRCAFVSCLTTSAAPPLFRAASLCQNSLPPAAKPRNAWLEIAPGAVAVFWG